MTNALRIEFDRRWVILLALLPLLYNPMLAIVNAHIMHLNFAIAAASEISIIFLIALYIFRNGIEKRHSKAIALMAVAFAAFGLTFLASGKLYVDFIRNMLIVVFFTLLGAELKKQEIILIFKITLSIVLSVLVLEVINLQLYVALFEPALYFLNTRGNEIAEFNELGVFGNALGFEGRFGYGLFDGPRTSSIFLEQVTLANMTIVIAVMLSVFYELLSRLWKSLAFIFIVLSLLSTESRLAMAVVILIWFGFFIFPKIHKVWLLFLIPIILTFGSMHAILNPVYSDDNFSGRISLGFGYLVNLDMQDLFGMGVLKVGHLWDAGYAYIICSGTIFGAVAFWVYLFGLYTVDSIESRRFFSGLLLFLVLALSIGGTAVFSIKVAFLFWLVAGFLGKTNENSISV
jgi:putative polymerase